jgi:hypothetical protein
MKTLLLLSLFGLSTLSLPARQNPGTQLLPGAALLFKNIRTKISDADKNDIFTTMGFIYKPNKATLLPVEGVSEKGFVYDVLPADMNRDGIEEIFIYTRFANNSSAYDLFIKKAGKYSPAGYIDTYNDQMLYVYDEKSFGYNIISNDANTISYKFNGDKYELALKYKPRPQKDMPDNIFDFSINYCYPVHTITNPDIVTAYLFRDVKTKLSDADKRSFADGFAIQYRNREGDTSLVLNDKEMGLIGMDKGGRVRVEIFPTDLNHDGVEEIFMSTNGIFFGQFEPDLEMYIKDKKGDYILQDSMSEAHLYARATGNLGYPDLIGDNRGGPAAMEENYTKFNVYRWNGVKYMLYKHNQPPLATDKPIEGGVNEAYQKKLPDSLLKNNFSFANAETKNEIHQQTASAQSQTVAANNQQATTEASVALSPEAAIIFKNATTKLTNNDKNEIALLTGLSENMLTEKTKKGKDKVSVDAYPTDFDNDGTEEIFICVTTTPLLVSAHTYFFYVKNGYGRYSAAPGKIGQGVRILLNGKNSFPDLITGTPGFSRQVWRWNGKVYQLAQTIPSNVAIPYQVMEIAAASLQYSNK